MIHITKPTTIEKFVGAREFLNIVKTQRPNILKTEIVSPRIGQPGLGGFKITFKCK